MGYKVLLSLGIVTTLLVFAHSVDLRDNSVENYTISGRRQKNHHEEEPATPTREDTNNGDEKYGAESRFVPSFGPFQPPEQYYDSPSLHTFSSSPILAYRYMFNHGYPYACHFPYSKYVTPFRPSASDYFLATHKSASSHFPQAHVTYPYAEEYNHYLPHAGSYTFPYPSHQFGVELHHGSFYPPHPASYSYLGVPQPPVSLRSRGTPHEFHSVVNYGHINLHHGDHFEPHNNGKTIPHHYPGFLVPPYVPGHFLHLGTKGGIDNNKPDSEEETKTSKDEKQSDVEKVKPKL